MTNSASRASAPAAAPAHAGTTFNRRPPARRMQALLLTAASVVSGAFAQMAPPPAPPAKEEAVELSPFVVQESDEVGYVATSSLAGSRVKTELKDIASQIDVMTPEFLADIGATNVAEAMVYSSNFGGPNDQNLDAGDGVGSTKVEARSRGMDMATMSSDFFATNLPTDFYNVERLNLAYGAQSVLFGLGNAGGVVDIATKRAKMRNQDAFEYRTDSWGSNRYMLDVNRVLRRDKLAVRVVGLESAARQFTKGGRNDQHRIFGSALYRPFENTTVRVTAEMLDQEVQMATNYISKDFVSPWFAAGRPLYDNSKGNGSLSNNDPLLVKYTDRTLMLAYGGNGDSVLSWNGATRTEGPHEQPGVTDSRVGSLLDNSIFPRTVDPRVRGRQNDINGYLVRAFIEQRITPEFNVEFAGNLERRWERSGGMFQAAESTYIYGDPNKYLPGGTTAKPQTQLNPNAGKLYIESNPAGSRVFDETKEARLTGVYDWDAARKLTGKLTWIGRHRLAFLGSLREDVDRTQAERGLIVGDTSFTTGDKLNTSRLLNSRYYLDSPADAQHSNYQAVPYGPMFGPWKLVDSATGTPFTVRLFDNPEGHSGLPVGTKVRDETEMLAWQSYLLRERIVGFVGLRRDKISSYSFEPDDQLRMDQLVPGDHKGLYRGMEDARFSGTPVAQVTTTLATYGIVVHPVKWLSAFYNKSENTSLPQGYLGPWGNPLPGTSSDGYDTGVRISLLQDRLALRLNVYEDNQRGFATNPFQQLRDRASTVEQRLLGDNRPAGIGPVPAVAFDPVHIPVSTYRSVADKTATGGDAVLVANLTSRWDLRVSVGHQRNEVKARGREWMDWIAQRLPVWQSAGGLGWDNVTVSNSDNRTIHQYYDQAVVTQIETLKLAVGTQRFREREWRANAFTNYRFSGELKGFNIGGGLRWWGAGNTGNGSIMVPGVANPVTNPAILYRNAGPQTFVDLLVGYRRQVVLRGVKLGWHAQVNIRNLFDAYDIEATRSDFSGRPFEFVRVTPRQVSLTLGVTF